MLLFQVVEIVKDTKVYIEKAVLDEARSSARNAKIFARALMRGVFHREALLTCSLRGYPSYGKGKKGSVSRSPLDQNAVNTILSKSSH